eukprot:2141146-Amphidinium_carterae.1
MTSVVRCCGNDAPDQISQKDKVVLCRESGCVVQRLLPCLSCKGRTMLDQWMTRGIFSTAPKYKPNISAIVMADPRTPETVRHQ